MVSLQALSAWVEKVLPFAALLLMLFVWVHLQGKLLRPPTAAHLSCDSTRC